MCIIVDNNVIARVLLDPHDADFKELHRALVSGDGAPVRMVYGGRLKREYLRNAKIRRLIAVLDAAGRAAVIPDTEVDAEEIRVKRLTICASDDEHIIALARVARVRLLCTHDTALQNDFRDKRLLDAPRGKIYLRAEHGNLLRRFCTSRK